VHAEHQQDVKAVAFAPQNPHSDTSPLHTLASASYDDTVRIWTASADEDQDEFCLSQTIPTRSTAWDLSFSPDGASLAVATDSGRLLIYNRGACEDFLLSQEIDTASPLLPVYSVSWSPNGRLLCSAGRHGTVQFWSRRGVSPHLSEADAYEQKPTGTALFDLFSPLPEWDIFYKCDINCVRWAPDGTSLVVVGDRGVAEIVRPSNPNEWSNTNA
jgi:WD40 repeat protein